MSSLYGAVSLIQVNYIAVLVSEDLDFDVLRLLDVFLDKYIAVSECLDSLVLSAVELRQEVLLFADDPHSSSAAACSCLEHYRVSCRIRELYRVIIVADGSLNTRDARNTDFVSDHFGLDLITEAVHHLVSRSYECDPCFFACLCKIGILRQESVTRMYRIAALCLRHADYLIDIKICIDRALALAYLV